jgi:uncharacterized protein YebE (UPF0316 family)
MVWSVLSSALFIFVLRIASVSLTTVRTVFVVRGLRTWAAAIGFVEVTIWVVAISQVIAGLDNVWNIIGYSGGFSAGTLLGMWIEDRLAFGDSELRIISMTSGPELAESIRQGGYGVTEMTAEGQSGPVFMLNVVTQRKQVADVIRLVDEIDGSAFVTVEDTRKVVRGYRPVRRGSEE